MGITLGMVVFIGILYLIPKYRNYRELQVREAQVAEQIRNTQREIRTYQENQRRFKSDREFVEHIARGQRRVYPGEIVFVYEGK